MTIAPFPAVAVEPIDAGKAWSVMCTCGWVTITATTKDASASAELHSIRCSLFRRWAHEQVDNLGFALGYYMPAQVLELLHVLVDEPAAAAQIMPWLVGIEDRGPA